MKKNKKPCGPIFSEEQKLVLLKGFKKQNTHTTITEYAKANNVSKSTLRDWSVRYGVPLRDHPINVLPEEERIALLEGFQKQNTYTTAGSYEKANNVRKGALARWSRRYGIPLGFHHRNQLPKEQKITLLEGFHKQSTHTTVAKYAKANNVSKSTLRDWSVLCGIPLGDHPGKVLQAEERIALLEGFQKQNTYTTIESYEKANNSNKGSLHRWSRRYGIPLEWHPRKTLPKEQKIALLDGFQKQNTYTTLADYAKANNSNKSTLRKWSVLYGMPLGWHHRKALPKEQKIALLDGFQKQNTYTTIEGYAKANNVTGSALYGWSVLYGMPLGDHPRKVSSEEQKIALLEGFQKQNTHATSAEYAKANNVSKSTLCGWSVRYKIPLGYHHRNYRKAFSEEQKIALLEGFQKQNTYTTAGSYEKANNVRKGSLARWSRRYGIPLGWHNTKEVKKTPNTKRIQKKQITDDPLL